MGRKYLLPIDPSEHCKRALKFYIENLHRDDDTLIFLHVVEINLKTNSINILTDEDFQGSGISSHLHRPMESGKALAYKYLEWGREAGINVKTFVRTDSKPAQAILKMAEEHEVDHIVMASRGLNAFNRTILGSVSNYVIHHTHVPVTVVPSHDDGKPDSVKHRHSLY